MIIRKTVKNKSKKRSRTLSTPVVVALIGGITTILVTVLSLIFKGDSPTNLPTAESIPSVTPIPAGLPELVDGKNVQMVLVPAGEFFMGSDFGNSDEIPMHSVSLFSFYIDKYEVTTALFTVFLTEITSKVVVSSNEFVYFNEEFIYDLICDDCGDWVDRIMWDGSKFSAETYFLNHPVSRMTWYGARAYCEWRGARLPTEAEWEKAARGTDSRIYPWAGDEKAVDCSYANYNKCLNSTAPVGVYEKGKSVYGVYDMAGNVREWVSTLFQPYPYTTADGRENVNTTVGYRVTRGGSWLSVFTNIRSSYRDYESPTYKNTSLGFRCARTP